MPAVWISEYSTAATFLHGRRGCCVLKGDVITETALQIGYNKAIQKILQKEGLNMNKEKFDITGMTCSACSTRVEQCVRKLPGVSKVSVYQRDSSFDI